MATREINMMVPSSRSSQTNNDNDGLHLLSAYDVSDTIQSTLQVLPHLILMKALLYRYYYYLHFTDKKTEERLSGLPNVTQLANGTVRTGFLTQALCSIASIYDASDDYDYSKNNNIIIVNV